MFTSICTAAMLGLCNAAHNTAVTRTTGGTSVARFHFIPMVRSNIADLYYCAQSISNHFVYDQNTDSKNPIRNAMSRWNPFSRNLLTLVRTER
ncbi:hypothetical protein CPB84DRAFT_1771976 [Gymnopilus junonius]|uniref:Secreted protein n=1 Tax=Gymnopilus junonius TaxID=109634 RepID=A0A9P5TR84_GYMJU|nr:hypothetical protein CPB84DRAFT_1771976 [Gymnopilus junonius]